MIAPTPKPTETTPPAPLPSVPQGTPLEQQQRSALEKQQALIQETLKKQKALEEQLRTQQKLIEQTLLVGKAQAKGAQIAWVKDPVTTTPKPIRQWSQGPSTESPVNLRSDMEQRSNSSRRHFTFCYIFIKQLSGTLCNVTCLLKIDISFNLIHNILTRLL